MESKKPEILKPDTISYLPGNSDSKKNDTANKKPVDPVVTGSTKVHEKTAVQRAGEAIFAEEPATVRSYVLWDVVLPKLKDVISEVVKAFVDGLLYGSGSKRNSSIERRGGASYVNYSAKYGVGNKKEPSYRYGGGSRSLRKTYEDIEFDKREDAENVLQSLVDLTMEYGQATVADYYELCRMRPYYTDNKYGWGELSEAKVVRYRDCYMIDLPRPEVLED